MVVSPRNWIAAFGVVPMLTACSAAESTSARRIVEPPDAGDATAEPEPSALSFDRITVRPLGENHALATGHFLLSGGGEADRSGWFSLTWEKTAAGWQIVHDHSS